MTQNAVLANFTMDVFAVDPPYWNLDKRSKEQVFMGLLCQIIFIQTNFCILYVLVFYVSVFYWWKLTMVAVLRNAKSSLQCIFLIHRLLQKLIFFVNHVTLKSLKFYIQTHHFRLHLPHFQYDRFYCKTVYQKSFNHFLHCHILSKQTSSLVACLGGDSSVKGVGMLSSDFSGV